MKLDFSKVSIFLKNNSKTIINLVIVAIISLAAYFIYTQFFKNNEETNRPTISTNEGVAQGEYTGTEFVTDERVIEGVNEADEQRFNESKQNSRVAIKDISIDSRAVNPELNYTEEELETLSRSCLETGFDEEGYNCKTGYNREGYNRDGYDKDGYDRQGCDRQGKRRDGSFCTENLVYDEDGYDQYGYDRQGFNKNGVHRDGLTCRYIDEDGYDQAGYDEDGFNREGYNREGYNRQGYNKEGFDRQGYNKEGYDKEGYDRQGYDSDGYNRSG